MYFEAEKFAGIAHYNPVKHIVGCCGKPCYCSVKSFLVPQNNEYYKRTNRLALVPSPFDASTTTMWITKSGLVEKMISVETVWDKEQRKEVSFENYKYEAFFDEEEKCIHCETTRRSRKEKTESKYLYNFEYIEENPFQQRNIVCKDLQRNRAERYSYHHDINGDLAVFDKRDDCRMRFTYDGEHRLLAKEEYEKNRQISLFDGPLTFYKGTYYEYDRQGRLVSVFEKDQQGELLEIKQVSFYEDGTSRTIEKDFLGKTRYTWSNSEEGKPTRQLFIDRVSPKNPIIVHDDMLYDEHDNIVYKKRRRKEYQFNARKNEWNVKRNEVEITYEYVYDREGNWIQREASVDGQTRFVTQRVIEYW